MTRYLQSALALVDRIGADALDSGDVRLQKVLLVRASLFFLAAGAAWGLIYIFYGEAFAGAIPLGYAIVSALSVGAFALTRRYELFRRSQLLLILFLPFLLQLTLGGFTQASAVIVWALLCPFGALVYDEPRRAPYWFLGYVALVVLSGVLQPYVRAGNNLPPELVLIFFVLNLGAVSALAFGLLYFFVGQKNRFYDLLHSEQQKSEQLLLNVLPEEIATRLKGSQQTIADQFDAVSVLFADLVGFTPLSTQLSPRDMVDLLNDIFMHFDALAEQFGVEKIRTIGDSYMVAAGVPCVRPDHAQALAGMALEMSRYIQSRPPYAGHTIDFRIGINSGPAVAGVIGRKKFQYDLWGDTVNTASRMESHGAGGKIQITRDTYELIKDNYICERRGLVAVKGKGDMETWFLIGARPNASSSREGLP